MNLPTPDQAMQNAEFTGNIGLSLASQKNVGTLSDASAGKTFDFNIQKYFGVTTPAQDYASGVWKIQVMARLRDKFSTYFSAAVQPYIDPDRYDSYATTLSVDDYNLLDQTGDFLGEMTAQAGQLAAPNIAVISFFTKYAVPLGLIALAVAYRNDIRKFLKI